MCNCGKVVSEIVCASCGAVDTVKHYKSRQAVSAAEKQGMTCKECGGTEWQTK